MYQLVVEPGQFAHEGGTDQSCDGLASTQLDTLQTLVTGLHSAISSMFSSKFT